MKENYTEYRMLQLKGLRMVTLTILSGIISAFGLWMILMTLNTWIALIFLLPALFLPFFILAIRSNKVRLGQNYIESRTLFGAKRIELRDVKKFGIFFAGAYTWPKGTNQTEIDNCKDEDLTGHQIYLTTNIEFDLNNLRPARHVRFPYKRELYFKNKDRLELKTNDRSESF